MKISVTEFSAPIGASVFIFCVHLQVGSVLCKMKIKMLILILSSFFRFFYFSFSHSYIIHMDVFSVKDFSATT